MTNQYLTADDKLGRYILSGTLMVGSIGMLGLAGFATVAEIRNPNPIADPVPAIALLFIFGLVVLAVAISLLRETVKTPTRPY